jgi:hypothetical protein
MSLETQTTTPSVVISIDELVLEGFSASEKYRIGESVQRELERLFSEPTRAKELSFAPTREFVDAGSFQMNVSQGDAVGAQIAQSVFASLEHKE